MDERPAETQTPENKDEIIESLQFLSTPVVFNKAIFDGLRILLEKVSAIEQKIDKLMLIDGQEVQNIPSEI